MRQLLLIFALACLGLLFAAALCPSLFTSHNPLKQNLDLILVKPNATHVLGCDWLGRDVFSRLVYGARESLLISITVALLNLLIPLLCGSFLIFAAPFWNQLYLGVLDILLAFPPLLFAILIASSLDSSFIALILALVLGGFANQGRILRSCMIEIKNQEFVLAAESLGASNWRIYRYHILPNMRNTLLILFTYAVGSTILAEATLNFLGLGAGVDSVSWGSMVNGGRLVLSQNWMVSLLPASLIALVVFAFQILGSELDLRLGTKKRGWK